MQDELDLSDEDEAEELRAARVRHSTAGFILFMLIG
jgi:hypothetical protein